MSLNLHKLRNYPVVHHIKSRIYKKLIFSTNKKTTKFRKKISKFPTKLQKLSALKMVDNFRNAKKRKKLKVLPKKLPNSQKGYLLLS